MAGIRKRIERAPRERGFTLIELLVVVIIIGVLASIAIPAFIAQQDQARASVVASALANARISLVSATADGEWPDAAERDSILDANGDPDVALLLTGSSIAQFCIVGTHARLAGSWAADTRDGVRAGSSCDAAGVLVPSP